MITIHHLGVSQSDRVVWLMEELGLPYELKWYNRGEDNLAPPAYLALHPAATAPVITDGDMVLTESPVILEHICRRYAGGRLTVGPSQPNYTEYLYWMHFNNSLLGLFFAQSVLNAGGSGPVADVYGRLVKRRRENYYHYLDARLGKAPYLAGPELTCADIMVAFNLTALPLFGGRAISDLPNVTGYVHRIEQRPAYAKAMRIAGPKAVPTNVAQG